MRANLEQQHKAFPFGKLAHSIVNCLRVIENEKNLLYSKHQDFNVLDAFRSFDKDAKGYINQVELISGLMEMKIEHTQAELNTFCRYFSDDNGKKVRFSDFSKAFLPADRDRSLAVLKRQPMSIKTSKPSD